MHLVSFTHTVEKEKIEYEVEEKQEEEGIYNPKMNKK